MIQRFSKQVSSFVSCACVLAVMFIGLPGVAVADALQDFNKLAKAGYIVADGSGRIITSSRAQDSFVPASTTKLITAWLALNHWGEDHRFSTEFYLDRDTSTLWVKAGGDPFLVSEELQIIAARIAELNPAKISQIALDVSLFEANLVVPGATLTSNPYDAVPSAIAANFNTIYLKKDNGKITSAEPQTPLTDFSLGFAKDITGSSLRVNTGRQSRDAERYFAQLLSQFLMQEGLVVEDKISWGHFPAASADVVHTSSRTLGEIIEAMLKYSTNFIANQIVLTLVAEETGLPANFTNVHDYMQDSLNNHFAWSDFEFYEGAGLSPLNHITPNQLIELLVDFKPWRHLLDEVELGVFAKTGTLTNVSTLAGYFDVQGGSRLFSIMINESVPGDFSRKLAVELSRY